MQTFSSMDFHPKTGKALLILTSLLLSLLLFLGITAFKNNSYASSPISLIYTGESSTQELGSLERATEISDPANVFSGTTALRIEPTPWHKPLVNLPQRTNFTTHDTLEFNYKSDLPNQTQTLTLMDWGPFIGTTINIQDYIEGGNITTSFKKVSIPLEDLQSPAFDLSSVLTLVFGTNPDSAFFYLDDLQLRATQAAQINNVTPENHHVLRIEFGNGVDQGSATTLSHYEITSDTDTDFSSPVIPSASGTSSRGVGFSEHNATSVILKHYVYLQFPNAFKPGNVYRLHGTNILDKFGLPIEFPTDGVAFTYDDTLVSPHIKVNQVGYFPNAEKVGIVGGWLGTLGSLPVDASSFQVVDAISGNAVFSGNLRLEALNEPFSGEDVNHLDFSSVQQEGTYYLHVPGIGRSYTFRIGTDIYQDVYHKTSRALYHQRCGTHLSSEHVYHPDYARPACHVSTDAFFHANLQDEKVIALYQGELIDSHRDASGGWHDAGDYNKYVTNASSPVHRILTAFELFPEKFSDGDLNIPESGNGVPDLLDELKWELDWLLKMQDPTDGGVYFKISSENFGVDNNLPHLLNHNRYYVFKTTHSTAAFAAMMAGASRVLQNHFPEASSQYLTAAIQAWNFLQSHPNPIPEDGNFQPSGINTGNYPDKLGDNGERAWAAAELFKTTGDGTYQDAYLNYRNQTNPLGLDAGIGNFFDADPFATWAFATTNQPGIDQTAKAQAIQAFVNKADQYVTLFDSFPYRTSYRPVIAFTGFGSYGVSTRYAFQLLQAFYLTGNDQYRDYALKNLDTQLGVNPLNRSFITGVGSNPPQDPLHLPSNFLSHIDPVPGIPIFGPMHHASEGNPFNAAIQQNSFPPNSEWPVLRRYADTHFVVEYSEFTIDEIATTATVYAFFADPNSVGDGSDQQPPLSPPTGLRPLFIEEN